MIMISETTRLKIANVCYANVAGQFAMFCNPKFRGENFTWKWFVKHCEENADLWIILSGYRFRSPKEEINSEARQMAKEIAETLVNRLQK